MVPLLVRIMITIPIRISVAAAPAAIQRQGSVARPGPFLPLPIRDWPRATPGDATRSANTCAANLMEGCELGRVREALEAMRSSSRPLADFIYSANVTSNSAIVA